MWVLTLMRLSLSIFFLRNRITQKKKHVVQGFSRKKKLKQDAQTQGTGVMQTMSVLAGGKLPPERIPPPLLKPKNFPPRKSPLAKFPLEGILPWGEGVFLEPSWLYMTSTLQRFLRGECPPNLQPP